MAMRPTGPVAAWVLGLLATAPFVVSAAVYCWGPARLMEPASAALLVYSVAIASFMGGSRWGLEAGRAMPRWGVLGPGIGMPLLSLLTWMGTHDLALAWRLGAFVGVFLLVWLWDTIFSELPEWYGRLRTTVTLIACVSLAFALENTLRL